MPYDYDLNEVKEQAHKDAMTIVYAGNKDYMVLQIEKVLVEVYIAGYKQAEEDAKIGA